MACSASRSTPAGTPPSAAELLAAVPGLYRGRGTPAALSKAISIVFGVDVAIHELFTDRDWAALNRASRLRSTRLFGRSRARFRVGGSALSTAPIRSFGNPDDDPLTAQANRIRVLVPPGTWPRRAGPGGAAPAGPNARHPRTRSPQVRPGGQGLVVGVWSAVGVDTALAPLPAPVLGMDSPAGVRTGGDAAPAQRAMAGRARIPGGHPGRDGPGNRHPHGGPVTDAARGQAMTTALPELPDFLRLSYFHGQMLAARDFQREQAYFVEKLKLRNRCLHGYGVACGLQVSPIPVADTCDTGSDDHQPRVTLHPGVALDCLGNEIVVRGGCPVELLAAAVRRGPRQVPGRRLRLPVRRVLRTGRGTDPRCVRRLLRRCRRVRVRLAAGQLPRSGSR